MYDNLHNKKKLLLCIWVKFPVFQFGTASWYFTRQHKESFSVFFAFFPRLSEILLGILFSRLKSPNSLILLHSSNAAIYLVFMALCWIIIYSHPCHTREPQTGHRTPALVSPWEIFFWKGMREWENNFFIF